MKNCPAFIVFILKGATASASDSPGRLRTPRGLYVPGVPKAGGPGLQLELHEHP